MASVSEIVGVPMAPAAGIAASGEKAPAPARVECSSRPQKKATKHHMITRPKKTQPWDVKRKPTVYVALKRFRRIGRWWRRWRSLRMRKPHRPREKLEKVESGEFDAFEFLSEVVAFCGRLT
uniref:Uncharacterized protein n=1 Tax=Kalanchoe fedtschenkoi TaxID=63787 RepID=A0A7N0V057_KALFE